MFFNNIFKILIMRSSLLIGLIALNSLLFSCGNKDLKSQNTGKSHKFIIEGKFENGNGRSLYLQKIGINDLVPLDTIVLDEKGDFIFRGSISTPEFIIIKTEDGPFINTLLYGREKVIIKADYNDIQKYSIEGSDESIKIKELSVETMRVINEIDKLNVMARDSANSPNYATLRIQGQEKFQSLVGELKAYSQKFIDENSSSLVSLLALSSQIGPQMSVFNPETDLKVFASRDSILFAIYPQNPLVQNLHEYVTIIKAQLTAQAQSAPEGMEIGTQVPDISLPSPDGKIITLSSLRGKIVLLDFWAAWCQPCRMENPNLVENYKKYHDKGFEIYQVSLDRTREDWINGIKQDNLNWTHVSELKYWNSSVVKQFNINGIPMSYLLDREGKIIATGLRGPALGAKLQELLP